MFLKVIGKHDRKEHYININHITEIYHIKETEVTRLVAVDNWILDTKDNFDQILKNIETILDKRS